MKELELSVWPDGTTRLVYWDNLSGHDRVFVLRDDGAVESFEDDNGEETFVGIDLVEILRTMVSE